MSVWEAIALAAIVALAVVCIVLSVRRNKKKGGCCGGCATCRHKGSSCCHGADNKDKNV